MKGKFVGINNNISIINILLSISNTFNLRRNSTREYKLPGNDADEIASIWNDVGKGLQSALDEYGEKYEGEQYKNSKK